MIDKCILCGIEIKDNKKVGLVINGYTVCANCECLLSITPVHSALYEYLKNGIKKAIIKEPA